MGHPFVDEVTIDIASGHGGPGCVAFRREKCVALGGPNGGDGGRGGDVILEADRQLATLLDYRFRPRQHADNGQGGMGSQCTGRDGKSCVIRVPVGTLAYPKDGDQPWVDLREHGERFLLARGGRGGKGNAHFKTARRQAPRFAQPGEEGAAALVRLELRLLADVGLVGLPNVGKSSTIAKVSACRPKIADYPFTTLVPNLGVVRGGSDYQFVVADVPGLIAGAHTGLGLGSRFLRHLSRVRCLVHVLTAALDCPVDDPNVGPWQDFLAIEAELAAHSSALTRLPRVLLLNRCDLPEVRRHMAPLVARAKDRGVMLFAVSAATGEGMQAWVSFMAQRISALREAGPTAELAPAADVAQGPAFLPTPVAKADAKPETIGDLLGDGPQAGGGELQEGPAAVLPAALAAPPPAVGAAAAPAGNVAEQMEDNPSLQVEQAWAWATAELTAP